MLELLGLSYPNVRRKLKGLGIRGQSGSVKFEPQTIGNVPTLLSLLVLFVRLTFCMIDSITMTLQLLVEGGHEGGRVVVRHKRDENLFNLAESSLSVVGPTHAKSRKIFRDPLPTPVRSRRVPGLSRVERAGRELVSNDRRF